MKLKKRFIGVLPLGEVPELAPKVIAAHIVGFLKLAAEILAPAQPPAAAFDESQGRCNAAKILNWFESGSYDNYDKIIGVLSVDLFIPTFAYVFGEAEVGGRHALVSLFRLQKDEGGRNPTSAVLYERAAKVAMHELGHLYSLTHCQDKNCLMHYSGGLADLDSLPVYFCRYCNTYFQEALGRQ